jgi:putative molybdopterin biosynthesis protein
MEGAVRNSVKQRRQRFGMQQQDLATQVGVSRQTLGTIESGETVPSTLIALNLARALQCRVEDLFSLPGVEPPFLKARLVASPPGIDDEGPGDSDVRVAVAQVGTQWMARRLDGDFSFAQETPADGLASLPPGQAVDYVDLRPLRDMPSLRRNLFVAGCDPAIGLLSRHLAERTNGPRVHWIELASRAALAELAEGRVHLAGIHLDDGRSGNRNAAVVRRRFGSEPMILVTLASWEQGFVFRKGRGRTFTSAADLAGKGVRVVVREAGAGAQELLEGLLKAAKLSLAELKVVATARGHRAVAQLIANGVGEVGVATRAVATAFGLAFAPLGEARFDLVFPADLANDERVRPILDCLSSSRFRKDLGAMTGYQTAHTGDAVQGTAG